MRDNEPDDQYSKLHVRQILDACRLDLLRSETAHRSEPKLNVNSAHPEKPANIGTLQMPTQPKFGHPHAERAGAILHQSKIGLTHMIGKLERLEQKFQEYPDQ